MSTKLSLFCTKLIEAGWLAAVVAVPLFFNIYTARTFEPDKITLLRIIVSIMVLAWLIKLMEEGVENTNSQPFNQRFITWLKQPMVLPALAITIVYIISTALSISPFVSLWGSYQRMQGTYTFISYVIVFALMAAHINTREQIDRLITIIIITSVPVSLYGIIQRNGLDPLPWAGDVVRRVASNMGNAIFVASYLIMIVPITVSRLVKSMKAILTEENTSWGHTILSAVYIFVLAIQLLTIAYSGSRGPQIGVLGSFALMGLLILLMSRQTAIEKTTLSIIELLSGLVLGITVAVIIGGLGWLGYLGYINETASDLLKGGILLGGVLVALILVVGIYAYLATSNKGWRWMWISWPVLGAISLAFVITLNIPDGPLEPLRSVPYLGRLGQLTETESGTGKVRILIWDGVLRLITPHEPLGIPGEFTDSFNIIRPLIGYGPESMFNAFAFVYPPELANVEARGSSADRSHNETMDSLAMTGIFGFAAFYFLMGSLFYYAAQWLGWVPDKGAKYRLIAFMVTGGIIGTIIPYIFEGTLTLSGVGLPFGVFAGLFIYFCVQAFFKIPDNSENTLLGNQSFLLIGLLCAFIGHFLEVHFVFSIAATYTYFWVYLGAFVALAKINQLNTTADTSTDNTDETENSDTSETIESAIPEKNSSPSKSKSRRRRQRQRQRIVRRPALITARSGPESWETWLGSLGLATAIILIILIFDFVPIQFDISTGNYSLVWMTSITMLVSFAIAMADTAIKNDNWQTPVNWSRGILLYFVTSLGYAGLYSFAHKLQRDILTSGRISDVMVAANGIVNILQGFYIALFMLMVIFAIMLIQKRSRGLTTLQTANWWLYPFLIIAVLLVIIFKNINVVKADIYLKEGERYRNSRVQNTKEAHEQKWANAIRIHEAGINVDSDEDFYYLMLALDHQLKAQDRIIAEEERQRAWIEGEKIATQARDLNRYNPDNTGNLGRYYFTLGQVLDRKYYEDAIDNFKKVIHLAPQNVQYYNLLAQVYYIQNNFDESIIWLKKSADLDPLYPPTWLQLGDTYAAKSDIDEAVNAHKEAILLEPNSFADDNFDNRLNFYISAEKTSDLIATFEEYIETHPETKKRIVSNRNKATWAIGHIYLRIGDTEKANQYIQSAVDQGYNNAGDLVALGSTYLEQKEYEKAESIFLQALQMRKPNEAQIYSSLGYLYATTGRTKEAIEANKKVVEKLPTDFDSHKNLAILYQADGNIPEALNYAKKALELAPEESKANITAFINQLEQTQSP